MTALDLVKSLDMNKLPTKLNQTPIRGFDGDHKGNQSYRIFVTYEPGAMEMLANSANFNKSDAFVSANHPGMVGSFREDGSPSLQLSYGRPGLTGEIDIDYDHNLGGKIEAGAAILFGKKAGAKSVDNSNYDKKGHQVAYEKKYGSIPRKTKQ